jgi:hypothetical protein
MTEQYIVYISYNDTGRIDKFKVVDHTFTDGFVHLAHKHSPMSQPNRYTTSISADNIKHIVAEEE